MTKAESDFTDQYTRKLMVELCHSQIVHGATGHVAPATAGWTPARRQEEDIFLNYAVAKGWLSKDKSKVLAAGWATAARFLKR